VHHNVLAYYRGATLGTTPVTTTGPKTTTTTGTPQVSYHNAQTNVLLKLQKSNVQFLLVGFFQPTYEYSIAELLAYLETHRIYYYAFYNVE